MAIRVNRHAPIKNKFVRTNEVPYMTKALRKAIIKRFELESKYLKNRNKQSKNNFRKQINFCSKL